MQPAEVFPFFGGGIGGTSGQKRKSVSIPKERHTKDQALVPYCRSIDLRKDLLHVIFQYLQTDRATKCDVRSAGHAIHLSPHCVPTPQLVFDLLHLGFSMSAAQDLWSSGWALIGFRRWISVSAHPQEVRQMKERRDLLSERSMASISDPI